MGLLEVGQLVTSKMGRDSGKKYVVIGFYDESHVQVADGFVRKMNRPKRKNTKHLVVHQESLGSRTLDDRTVREFIERHSNEESSGEEGPTYGQG
jgi:ribosomal protein L14E/L6E/L27E